MKQGFAAEPKLKNLTVEEAAKESGRIASTWGLNSKSHANRARKYLGWKPTRKGLKELIPEIVSSEAARSGIKPRAT